MIMRMPAAPMASQARRSAYLQPGVRPEVVGEAVRVGGAVREHDTAPRPARQVHATTVQGEPVVDGEATRLRGEGRKRAGVGEVLPLRALTSPVPSLVVVAEQAQLVRARHLQG